MEPYSTYKQEFEILDLLLALKTKIWMIVAVTVVCAVMGFVVSNYAIIPQYEASTDMIVNARQNPGGIVTNDNITSAKNLVDTYAVIIKSNIVLDKVIKKLKIDMDYETLRSKVKVQAINNTPIMRISVCDSNPELAVQIIETISDVAPDVIVDAVEAGSCKVVSHVSVSKEPVYPNEKKIMLFTGLFGFVGIVGILIIKELLEDYITDDLDVQNKLDVPALGTIPENVKFSGGNEKKEHKNNWKVKSQKGIKRSHEGASFEYVEAYKSLRTNLEFISAANHANCFIMTSALPDEGKSTMTIELATSLASRQKKVIIVECDLRKPVMRTRLNIRKFGEGLTSFLTGKAELQDCIYRVKGSDISVIPAGVIPPNPSELLGQEKMVQLVQNLKQYYDYVLLDAPPVSIVTDATVLGHIADGVLLVVRSQYAQTNVVRLAQKKLSDVNVKIFGVIINRYKVKRKNGRSGYYYSYGYGSYEAEK